MQVKNLIKRVVIVVIATYFGLGGLLFVFQKNYIYFPDKQDFNSCLEFDDSEKLNINGTRAYYKKNSDRVAIFYHGNAGSACQRVYIKEEFEKLGFSYIIVEYSGYSGENQKPSKKLLMENVEDVNQFVAKNKFHEIVIVGESLGASLAIYHSTLIDSDKLLLISPFHKMADIAKRNYPVYPISIILTEDYNNAELIKNSRAKSVEVIHGTKDEVIPAEQSKKLFDEIGIVNKKYIEIQGAGHNDMFGFEETYKNIDEFLGR